jgi:PAS domain S-box-containing protein
MEGTVSGRERDLALAQVTLSIAHARDLPELMRLVRSAVRQLTGADGATLILREGDHCRYADEDAIGPLWKGHRFLLTNCISGWVMLHDKAVIIDDIYSDPRVPHEAYRSTFVKSLGMVPIRRGEPMGAIGCYWARRNGADSQALRLQQVLADAAALAFGHMEMCRKLMVAQARARDEIPLERLPSAGHPAPGPDEILQALRNSEARYRLLVEQAPDGIFVVDHEGRFLDVNNSGVTMLGYSRDEILSRCIADIVVPEEIPRITEEVERVADDLIVTSEWCLLRKDATTFPGEVVAQRLPDGRRLGILRDITERRRAEAARRDSESFYRQTLESIPGMVFITRPDGYFDYLSRQWVEYTGVPMPGHLGDRWRALLHPEDRAHVLAAWHDAAVQRRPYDLEYRIKRHDGSYEWFLIITRPICDDFGGVIRWFGVAMNIERRMQAEQSLAARHDELKALIDTMPAMVYVKDAELRYVVINRAACAIMERNSDEVIGLCAADVLSDELARASQESDRLAMNSGQPISGIEHSWSDRAGMTHWLSTSKTPLFDGDGRFTGLVGVSVDITEHKREEERRLIALARQRDALVREVHHRIKNHLQGVTGLLRNKITQSPGISEPLEETIGKVQAIDQVYGLQSRSVDGKLSIYDLMHSTAGSAPAPVQVHGPPEAAKSHLVVTGDEAVAIALIINELITNAVKHQEATAVPQPVRVSLDITAETARITIRNAPARLPSGFDFARGHGVGTGLQLVMDMLPAQGSRLVIRQDGKSVEASLTLSSPVVFSP